METEYYDKEDDPFESKTESDEELHETFLHCTLINLITIAQREAKKIRARLANTKSADINNTWVFTALLGGVLFSIGNFLMGNISIGGIYARMIIMIGNLLASIVY